MTLAVLAAVMLAACGQPQASVPDSHDGTPRAPAPAKAEGPFKVLKALDVGGEGGWDIVRVDSGDQKLYVPRSTHVMVIDVESGKVVGDIPGTAGVHGVCIGAGKGFTSNGTSGDVTVFQL